MKYLSANLKTIGLAPAANAFAGTVRSDVVKAWGDRVVFTIIKGVGTTGTATITGGTLALAAGANTFAIAPIAIGGQTYAFNQATLSVASVVTGAAASITKTGNGLLQLSAASTFGGGVNVDTGGQLQLHQGIYRALRGIEDVDQSFVRTSFKLLA